MRYKLLLLFGICSVFSHCSKVVIEKIQGEKKEKDNPVVSYFFCVAQTNACIESDGEDCFVVRDNPHYFDAGGGGVEKFCLDKIAEIILVTETGGM
ncbi:hypothetical protein [Leptospira neocaledonica]|uniref:hypothetical protein n=1 Tax=Leptospira neocaledonica TaxID=2023192 RepID=UPI001FCC5153|nr:hypothetical protein [Leptospira neocaledonica]